MRLIKFITTTSCPKDRDLAILGGVTGVSTRIKCRASGTCVQLDIADRGAPKKVAIASDLIPPTWKNNIIDLERSYSTCT